MTNPFFTTLAQGVETAAREAGISLLLANSDEREDEERRLVPMLLQRQVDGLLVVPAGTGEETVRAVPGPWRPAGGRRPAARRAGRRCRPGRLRGRRARAGRLLVGLGHRRMAVLSGPETVPTAVDRVAGFTRALVDEAGLPAPLVLHGAFTIESGRAMTLTAMAPAPRPTALFAANNFIAIGVQHALAELGLRVPEDVAVVGFDDLPPAMVTFPFLTVVAQPAFEIGRRDRRGAPGAPGEPGARGQDVVLPTELVIRRSSGGPLA